MKPESAAAQRDTLEQAVLGSPVPQVRYLLQRMGREWRNAIADHEAATEAGEDAIIAFAGSLSAGMLVWQPNRDGNWLSLVRTMQRDGQLSLHIEDADGRPTYRNLLTGSSPVVVAR